MFASQRSFKHKVKYGYVVLYEKHENVDRPFASYPRNRFSNTEIPEKWLESILDESSRMKGLKLESLSDNNMCLFAKIDEGEDIYLNCMMLNYILINYYENHIVGVTKEHRETKVETLNTQYRNMRESGISPISALNYLVEENPFRLLTTRSAKKVFSLYSLILILILRYLKHQCTFLNLQFLFNFTTLQSTSFCPVILGN